MASYTGKMTAFLTSNNREASIKTLEQLAKSNDFKPLIYGGMNAEQLFKYSSDSTRKIIYGKFINDMNLNNSNDLLYNLIKYQKYVFIGEYSSLKYYSNRYCDLVTSDPFDYSNFGN
jgi:hypothetical protein